MHIEAKLPKLSLTPTLLLTLLGIGAAIVTTAGSVAAGPMDLADARARSIRARFEVSPSDQPGAVRAVYTALFPAYLSPGPEPGQITVTISGDIVERYLLGASEPVPGSFSDFVWIFDRASGDVEMAAVSGVVYRTVAWGWFEKRVEAAISIEMDTHRHAGFEAPRNLFGQITSRYCEATDFGCQWVPSRRYDPESGYVNAVGHVTAQSSVYRGHFFSPLGEALFFELDEPATTAARARLAPLPDVSASPAIERHPAQP